MKSEIHRATEEIRTAMYSECGAYRYCLDILWNGNLNMMAVIGLNPSTATHLLDDPTLRRVKRFARDWGYGGVRMLNAFALRSRDPIALFRHPDPIGPENTLEFLYASSLDPTIAAWGGNIRKKHWKHFYRGHDICKAIRNLQCFRLTGNGDPEHPLYLPADLKHVPFSYQEVA